MLAILAVWGLGASTLLAALYQQLIGTSSDLDALPMFLISGSLFFTGLLLLPSAYYSLMRAIGRPVEVTPPLAQRLARLVRPTLLIFILPGVLAIGYWVSQNSALSWLLLPPLHVLAISLPLLWLAYLGARDLPLGPPQRLWGVFASGVVIAPALIMFAELFALLVAILIGAAAISSNPAQVEVVMRLAELLQSQAPPSEEAVLQLLQPILNSPLVIFSVIAFAAVIVPLIEEAIKPIGLWLLAGRRLDPAAGFAAGLLSGAGYAVIESLLLTSGGQEWVFLVFARIGTGAVHILTSGLVGWALVQAWNAGRYLRLGAVYLLAVLIHGAWNGLTMVMAFSQLTPAHGTVQNVGWLAPLGQVAPFLLGSIAVLSFFGLIVANRALARQEAPQPVAGVESIV
jgi:hypothetical protein